MPTAGCHQSDRRPSLSSIFLLTMAIACISSAQSYAVDNGTWSFWIEQNGTRKEGTEIRLSKSPFTFHFRGPAGNDYGLAATPNIDELPNTGNLETVFRLSNGLLVDSPNTKISVSDAGVIKKGWSSWNLWAYHDAKEKGLISGFQKKIQNADGTVTLVRSIDQLCIDDGSKDTCRPMGSPVFKKFHMLIATMPPFDQIAGDKNTRWLNPKLVTIEFE